MGVLDDLGSFTLEGKLDKIKRKMTPLTGSTNNRFFRIERRPVNGRPELTLCYYLDDKHATGPANEVTPLSNMVHIAEVWREGRLQINRPSELNSKRAKAVNKHKDLAFEVDATTRHYLLIAKNRQELCRWVAGLQYICDMDQTLPWPRACGRLPPVEAGSRSAKHTNFYTDTADGIPATPKGAKKTMPLPDELDYGINTSQREPAKAKATPNDVQHRLEAAIRARQMSGEGHDDSFYYQTGGADTDDYGGGAAAGAGGGAGAGAHMAQEQRANLDRTGVAYDDAHKGRTVGAHLSMADLSGGAHARVQAPRDDTAARSSAPAPVRDLDVEHADGAGGKDSKEDDNAGAGAGAGDDDDDDDGAAAGGDAAGGDAGGDDDFDEEAERERLRMRMAARERKRKNKAKKKKKRERERQRAQAQAPAPAPSPAAALAASAEDGKADDDASGGQTAAIAGVKADNDFVEADWDDDDGKADDEDGKVDDGRPAKHDAGVKTDENFVTEDWDDEEDNDADAAAAAAPSGRRVADPGVKPDEDFAEADWDDEE